MRQVEIFTFVVKTEKKSSRHLLGKILFRSESSAKRRNFDARVMKKVSFQQIMVEEFSWRLIQKQFTTVYNLTFLI